MERGYLCKDGTYLAVSQASGVVEYDRASGMSGSRRGSRSFRTRYESANASLSKMPSEKFSGHENVSELRS